MDDSSIRWYYPPTLGADLRRGFDTFQNLDDAADEHLDSLLKTVIAHEEKTGEKVEAGVITWRGMMTKVGWRCRYACRWMLEFVACQGVEHHVAASNVTYLIL